MFYYLTRQNDVFHTGEDWATYLEKQGGCVLQSACSESDREVVCEASAAHSVKVLLK